MTTLEIAELFKQYVDDADQTFVSADDVVSFLNIGYREFCSMVIEQDANVFTAEAVYTNINAQEVDLSNPGVLGPTILGSSPTQAKLYRLIRVSRCETNGDPRYYLQSSRSLVEMRNDINRYMLRGSKLLFSDQTDNILVEYVGFDVSPFTIANTIAAGGVFIDDITTYYGDLIALLASKHYMIKDFAANPVLVSQLEVRTNALIAYLSTGREWNSRNNVIGTDELTYLGY